eukprot:PhM_4_TR13929/c0_g1_i2/m.100558
MGSGNSNNNNNNNNHNNNKTKPTTEDETPALQPRAPSRPSTTSAASSSTTTTTPSSGGPSRPASFHATSSNRAVAEIQRRGQHLVEAGKLTDARQYYRNISKALETDVNAFQIFTDYGDVCVKLSAWSEAERVVSIAYKLSSQDQTTSQQLVTTLETLAFISYKSVLATYEKATTEYYAALQTAVLPRYRKHASAAQTADAYIALATIAANAQCFPEAIDAATSARKNIDMKKENNQNEKQQKIDQMIETFRKRHETEQRIRAALRIQCFIRLRRNRRLNVTSAESTHKTCTTDNNHSLDEVSAALCIQRAARKFLRLRATHRDVQSRRKSIADAELTEYAALSLQAVWRGHAARKAVRKNAAGPQAAVAAIRDEVSAALCIQRAARKFLRLRATHRSVISSRALQADGERAEYAAIALQAIFRGVLARAATHAARRQYLTELEAAVHSKKSPSRDTVGGASACVSCSRCGTPAASTRADRGTTTPLATPSKNPFRRTNPAEGLGTGGRRSAGAVRVKRSNITYLRKHNIPSIVEGLLSHVVDEMSESPLESMLSLVVKQRQEQQQQQQQ